MKKIALLAIIAAALLCRAAHALDSKCEKCETFRSAALGADIGYRIFLPPGYDKDAGRRYAVVYLLHGYNFMRNNPDKAAPPEGVNHWMDQERIPEIATCLMTQTSAAAVDGCIKEKGIEEPNDIVSSLVAEHPGVKLPLPPMIIVTPDGKNSFYMDRRDGKALYPPMDAPDVSNGLCKGATGQFETYITNDLIKHIDSTYNTIADRQHRGVGGFSMGGIGSMLLALKHQSLFISVTSLSATYNLAERVTNPFDLSYAKTTIPEMISVMLPEKPAASGALKPDLDFVRKNDPYTVAKALDKIDLAIYFDAGANDFFSSKDNFSTFKKFDALLKEKGVTASPAQHVIPSSPGNGKGLHTSRYWRSRVGVILAFHAAAFGAVK